MGGGGGGGEFKCHFTENETIISRTFQSIIFHDVLLWSFVITFHDKLKTQLSLYG